MPAADARVPKAEIKKLSTQKIGKQLREYRSACKRTVKVFVTSEVLSNRKVPDTKTIRELCKTLSGRLISRWTNSASKVTCFLASSGLESEEINTLLSAHAAILVRNCAFVDMTLVL